MIPEPPRAGAATAKDKPALSALLALLCAAALVLSAWPYVGARIVSLASEPRPLLLSTLHGAEETPEWKATTAIESDEALPIG
tara:strand:- start:216 stop:464 length:249 start_codon:yes stop_codon:yes gene_type:complete